MSYVNYKTYTDADRSYDSGLRAYMIGVFQNMGIALLISALVALFVASNPAIVVSLFRSGLIWLVFMAQIGMSLYLQLRVHTMTYSSARMLLFIYSGLMGVTLSTIFLAYTAESIVRVFFISASMFGAMAIYGHTTKKDLSEFGSFLMMGLIGLVIASLFNIFFHSSALSFALSIVAVLVFTGMTAYDVRRLKDVYYTVAGDSTVAAKVSILGALMLYLDFINIFVNLLYLLGDRRSE